MPGVGGLLAIAEWVEEGLKTRNAFHVAFMLFCGDFRIVCVFLFILGVRV